MKERSACENADVKMLGFELQGAPESDARHRHSCATTYIKMHFGCTSICTRHVKNTNMAQHERIHTICPNQATVAHRIRHQGGIEPSASLRRPLQHALAVEARHAEQAEHELLHELSVCRALPLRHAHELAEARPSSWSPVSRWRYALPVLTRSNNVTRAMARAARRGRCCS